MEWKRWTPTKKQMDPHKKRKGNRVQPCPVPTPCPLALLPSPRTNRWLLTVTSFPRLTEASTRFIPSPLPICQIRASAAWFLKGQSLACSSYQIVLWRPLMQHELLAHSAQLTPRGSRCHNVRNPDRTSRILPQPSSPVQLQGMP